MLFQRPQIQTTDLSILRKNGNQIYQYRDSKKPFVEIKYIRIGHEFNICTKKPYLHSNTV